MERIRTHNKIKKTHKDITMEYEMCKFSQVICDSTYLDYGKGKDLPKIRNHKKDKYTKVESNGI